MATIFKWAGNKQKIADIILSHLGSGKRLIEPFVGSASIFMASVEDPQSEFESYVLGDNNKHLIDFYKTLKSCPDSLIQLCSNYFGEHSNSAEYYYDRRSEFNLHPYAEYEIIFNLLFLYLNRHCFNGLCRFNQKGKFNVPFGKYKKPYFPEKEMRAFAEKSSKATIVCADFLDTMRMAKPGDVVYCDPPYVPLSPTANFTQYSPTKFGEVQQKLLAKRARELQANGVRVVISNHDTGFTRELYEGAQINTLEVQRNISCKGKKRNKSKELIAVLAP